MMNMNNEMMDVAIIAAMNDVFCKLAGITRTEAIIMETADAVFERIQGFESLHNEELNEMFEGLEERGIIIDYEKLKKCHKADFEKKNSWRK